jgi:hypothetical protein
MEPWARSPDSDLPSMEVRRLRRAAAPDAFSRPRGALTHSGELLEEIDIHGLAAEATRLGITPAGPTGER